MIEEEKPREGDRQRHKCRELSLAGGGAKGDTPARVKVAAGLSPGDSIDTGHCAVQSFMGIDLARC